MAQSGFHPAGAEALRGFGGDGVDAVATGRDPTNVAP